jgi:CelD/BcsL family acetyltransferase involved in cellulose biosynthesis
MSVMAQMASDTMARPVAGAPGWTVTPVSLAAAETRWRQLETHGLATPYQRFDWLKPYADHAASADGRPCIIEVSAPQGRALAFLPLVLSRAGMVTVARFMGGKHANFHMPVLDRAFAEGLDEAGVRALLAGVAAAAGGVDAFLLQNQPKIWEGQPNPFVRVAAQDSPSQAYRLKMLGDCEATLNASMSSHARKKHKNKRARFSELGPSRMFIATTQAERERVLETFFRQKGLRFAEMGIADPFADAGVRRFLHAAGTPGPDGSALRIAALELNGELVATYIGAVHHHRFSGMATSFEPDPAIMKVSPGEVLLIDLIRHECRAGTKVFDLGVGEARYKTTICNETEELSDSFIGVTARGKAAAALSRAAGRAKAAVKRSPLALSLLRRLRRDGA